MDITYKTVISVKLTRDIFFNAIPSPIILPKKITMDMMRKLQVTEIMSTPEYFEI